MSIVAGVGQAKSKFARVLTEPGERLAVFEDFLQHRVTGRRDVDRAPAVMLAEAGRRGDLQNLVDCLPLVQFLAQNFLLVVDGAVSRHQLQLDAVTARGGDHRVPGCRRGGQQALFPPVDVRADGNESARLGLQGQGAAKRIVGRDADGGMHCERCGVRSARF